MAALVAAGLLVLTACGGSEDSADADSQESTSASADPSEQPGAPEPDLEGIPDPVAEVNGEPIGREEFVTAYERQFQSLAAQAQSTGQPLDQDQLKEQTAQNLVGTELLTQEAERRKISASDAAVDREVDRLIKENGLESRADLKPLLKQQDLTLEDLLDQVAIQIQVEKLLATTSPGAGKVSKKEIRDLYDQAKAQQKGAGDQAQAVPPLQQVRSQIVDQIRTQKQGEAAQSLVAKLRKDAEVTINL